MDTQAVDKQSRGQRRWRGRAVLLVLVLLLAAVGLWISGAYKQWLPQTAQPAAPIGVALAPDQPQRAEGTSLFDWSAKQEALVATFEAQGLAVGEYLYVLGGFTAEQPVIAATTLAQKYHLASDTWSSVNALPEAITHAGIAADGTKIYLVGGFIGDHPGPTTDHVWIYDTATDTWSAGPNLPEPRAAGAAAVVDGQLHFFGGTFRVGETYTDTVDHYVLDVAAAEPQWQARAPLLSARNHIGGVAVDGMIYAVGGQDGADESWGNLARVDRYDPTTDTWIRVADLNLPRSHVSASVLEYQGNLVVLGGTVNGAGGGAATSSASVYDPLRNIWVHLPWLPEARKTPVAGIIDQTLVVATGYGSAPSAATWSADLADVWQYLQQLPQAQDAAAGGVVGNTLYVVGDSSAATLGYRLGSNTWVAPETLAPRPHQAAGHASAVFSDTLFLFGGNDAAATLLQRYAPVGNSWITETMPLALSDASALAINDAIYLVGGTANATATTTTLRYDPATTTWTPLADLPAPRSGALLASAGNLLWAFGGRDAADQPTSTVYMYDPATDSWSTAATTLPTPRSDGGNAIFLAGRFYVLSGQTASGLVRQVDIYDPATDEWTQGADIPSTRRDTLVVSAGGMIYVVGGNWFSGASNALESYLPGGSTPASGATPTPASTTTPTVAATPSATATLIPQTPTATPFANNEYFLLLPMLRK